MALSANEVADRAADYAARGYNWGPGYCLKFSRTCAGAPAGTYDAALAWKQAKYRHASGIPPRGSFVFWTGGAKGHGHITVSDGAGYCWSTDIKRSGRVDRVSIAYVSAKWRNLTYVGWSEDVNGVQVEVDTSATSAASVMLAHLKPYASNDSVKRMQLALRRKGFGKLNPSGATGYFGKESFEMVKAFQQSEPSLAGDADGVPGPKTVALLGLHAL